jgi:hypothetical protein
MSDAWEEIVLGEFTADEVAAGRAYYARLEAAAEANGVDLTPWERLEPTVRRARIEDVLWERER